MTRVSARPNHHRLLPLVRGLASLRLTLLALILLAITVASTYVERQNMTWPLALPLGLLAINLLAALWVQPAIRKTPWLLAFHLALLALLVLAALGRLTYLKARIEVTEGQAFDGIAVELEAGPWHRKRLDRIGFVNQQLVIDYSAATTIQATRNQVRWRDAAGHWHDATLRENEPLTIFGYRLYVTSGKGFAPVFAWHPETGQSSVGAIHLPKFPSDRFAQQSEWQLPDGRTKLWAQLLFDQPVLVAGQPSQLNSRQDSRVVLWAEPPAGRPGPATRHELRPGDVIALPGGKLEYRELRLWMGYLVYYDWTVPWLLAAALSAAAALSGHFLNKFRATRWHEDNATARDV
jgi:cytochrome c biogenesis protein